MPTNQLTFEQVVEAVRQLPERDRGRLLREVTPQADPEGLHAAANRLRKKYQASPKKKKKKKKKRMSDLLAKGSAGELTAKESRELDQLVHDFERRTAAMAEELAATYGIAASRTSREKV